MSFFDIVERFDYDWLSEVFPDFRWPLGFWKDAVLGLWLLVERRWS